MKLLFRKSVSLLPDPQTSTYANACRDPNEDTWEAEERVGRLVRRADFSVLIAILCKI